MLSQPIIWVCEKSSNISGLSCEWAVEEWSLQPTCCEFPHRNCPGRRTWHRPHRQFFLIQFLLSWINCLLLRVIKPDSFIWLPTRRRSPPRGGKDQKKKKKNHPVVILLLFGWSFCWEPTSEAAPTLRSNSGTSELMLKVYLRFSLELHLISFSTFLQIFSRWKLCATVRK